MTHHFQASPEYELKALKAALPLLRHFPERDTDLIKKTVMRAAASVPVWPTYTGISKLVGVTPSGKLTVYVDPSLGPLALDNAENLVADGDSIIAANDALFGTVSGMTNVIIFALGGRTNGEGGADHTSCNFTTGQNIEVDTDYATSDPALGPPQARLSALYEAELSECSMGGILCGLSTGEGLSRWCAYHVAGNVLKDFSTSLWWLVFGTPNWVDQTEQTDRGRYSIGCTVVFLSWLQASPENHGLGIPLSTIAPHMVALGDTGTLAELYTALTGKTTAWADFQAAIVAAGGVQALWTAADKFGDDVFNSLGA